ncbi:3-methyladenine DNA glycosylase AlkC [Mucilaginibacter lappiensis]|uniref:3-methyladenine DNA glycosylase AlkC n=1 Tax=Mucilaginibacter lappiensis TaxID=354630 RepID=A0ABR6PNR2_9SPHI|nr:DNA alkylation repair protein [Mucilaginibacter lappiensis]MBB6111412.1 3-methyladenine DNA glycosylase AlkC [Mucilaginibacter lappiensis]SIR78727.1 3-methyladenine DNA glycosylase AlkC [Mucilaginibacter lappiensis]
MSSLLKDIYSPAFYGRFTEVLTHVLPDFDKKRFLSLIFMDGYENKALKERMRHNSIVLHEFMPANFTTATEVVKKIITRLRVEHFGEDSLAMMFLPDYIEVYGLDDYEVAVKALEFITQFVSCEFAVRPFLLKYTEKIMKQMQLWSVHENYKVRRFASEGSRPRLPWGLAIPALKKDPTQVLAVLENLKNDPSEWVRKSVANNLNDISKDHPEVMIAIVRQWHGVSKETDAIIKHASRTLLKSGHAEILQHYGLESKSITMTDFQILTPEVKIGDSLEFTFTVTNDHAEKQTVRLEYGVYYNKANGQLSKKVFKISERLYLPGERAVVKRKQSFKLITTRTFYPGKHRLSIIINGEEKELQSFDIFA